MTQMSDATPAYRGYRLQALYTLACILRHNERQDLTFQPEGVEDIAIWDASDRLLEAIQVKAYSANLTLSLLSPEKADSFLYRTNELLNAYPEMRVKIASFGGIGDELQNATREEGKDRVDVAKKISDKGLLSKEDSLRLLDKLEIISVSEERSRETVFDTLRNSCTGVDPNSAFDLLNFWLYTCAENKSKITRDDLIQRINDIGRFVRERNAHYSQWFSSIFPIENKEVDPDIQKDLSNEFYRGVSARYEHILADVDKPRVSKLNEIFHKFQEKQVVIVHGASGQGKTTIAYRYLHEFFPDQWRFQVKAIEGRQHSLDIATALSGQAKALGIPIAIYIDVSPKDTGWDELVKQLSSHKNIQILVTVREEDFRRASISGAEIQFAEVELQFERPEAEEIYQFLVETEMPNQFLDFDDAWNRFGGSGPLMEFVYLVTQGDSLRERLQQQVEKIQDEVQSDTKLELLRLVSVASAFEARLKLKELVQFLKLPSPQRSLQLLEKEYLLRTSDNGSLVGGLHPIRSTILADILSDPTFSPWVDSASTCLPFIFEKDLGSFLLYTFSRHRQELKPLLTALDSYQPRHWVAIAGITRALIWLGVKEYVERNWQVIEDARKFVNCAWMFVLDFDITNAVPGSAGKLQQSTLAPLFPEEKLTQIHDFQNRQTDKNEVFIRASRWLSHLTSEPILPQYEFDWRAMAEVLFWIGRLQTNLPVSDWLAKVEFDVAIETLPLEILADVALGLFYGDESVYRSWLDTNYATLLSRFRQETSTVVWEDDGQNVRTHFIVEMLDDNASLDKAENTLFNSSMKRLRLLRRFFPNCEQYRSQGYGHLSIGMNAQIPD
ncbi:MAG: hypothetical protein WBG70_04775, partial [Spirulinaceae cyanobacterium]